MHKRTISILRIFAAACASFGCGGETDGGGKANDIANGGSNTANVGGTESDGSTVGGTGSNGSTFRDTGGTIVLSGGRSSSVGTGGSVNGGVGTGATGGEPWLVVENGAKCSPVASRGCSVTSVVSQMICSAGNVWQWESDCAAGTVCDPRPGLKVGQCVAPDQRCGVQPGIVCDDTYGSLLTCVSPGFVSSSVEQCLSGECADETSCASWTPCKDDWMVKEGGLSLDCSGLCGRTVSYSCATPSRDSTAGRTFLNDCDYRTATAVPPAISLPTVAACPSVHVFWVVSQVNGCGETFDVHLPAPYSMIVVSSSEANSDQSKAESKICGINPGVVSATQFTPSADEAAIIFTTDANAPGFKLIID